MEKKIALIACLFLFGWGASAQEHLETEAKIQSIFIYNFAKYIEWPNGYNQGDFVIGVLGNGHINEYLEKMAAGKTKGDRKLAVRSFQNINELEACHVIFIPDYEASKVSKVADMFQGKPVLLITSRPKIGEKGVGINFIMVDGKIKYELNSDELIKRGFKVAKQLETLAVNN